MNQLTEQCSLFELPEFLRTSAQNGPECVLVERSPPPSPKQDTPEVGKYLFIEDPGHGWIRVRITELASLGIAHDISTYSYQDGVWAYLEEDSDLSKFARAKGWTTENAHKHWKTQYQENTFVRNLPAYNPPKGPNVIINGTNVKLASKFEALADTMQVQIDAKLSHDRQTNTPKRMAQAMSARIDGERLQRTQQILRILARMHRAGNCPATLRKLTSKKAVLEEMGADLEPVMNGYHTYYRDLGKPREDASAVSLDLWALLSGKSEADQQADKLAQMVRDLQFSKIPGYFPTPPEVIELMLDHAQIEAGHHVLEPSAGSGAIIDAIEARSCNDVMMTCYEINSSLTNILEAKGYPIHGSDFLQADTSRQFDRVVMNPPFEKLADIDHVLTAFARLKPGGRLVSVMSPGAFFRDCEKAQAFRLLFEELGGEKIELPEGSFKASGTGVASVLVVVDKP